MHAKHDWLSRLKRREGQASPFLEPRGRKVASSVSSGHAALNTSADSATLPLQATAMDRFQKMKAAHGNAISQFLIAK